MFVVLAGFPYKRPPSKGPRERILSEYIIIFKNVPYRKPGKPTRVRYRCETQISILLAMIKERAIGKETNMKAIREVSGAEQ